MNGGVHKSGSTVNRIPIKLIYDHLSFATAVYTIGDYRCIINRPWLNVGMTYIY